jgi:hypothetical protein
MAIGKPRFNASMWSVRAAWGACILLLACYFASKRHTSLSLNLLHTALPFGMAAPLFPKEGRWRWILFGIMLGLGLASLIANLALPTG